jgi:hypothetical protein
MKKKLITTVALILLISTNTAFAKTNAENEKQIKKTCLFLKSNYSVSVFDSWRNGKESDENLIKEIDKNIINVNKQIIKNKLSMKTNLKNLSKSQEIIKIGINEKNLDKVATGLSLNLLTLKKINVVCLSIK